MNGKTTRGFELFRVLGVQIAIDASWLVIVALVLWSLSAGYFPAQYPGAGWLAYLVVGASATLLFFASVLIHELSHATMANALGQPVRRITLFIFGGMAHLSREPRDAASEFKIAVVGPLTSVALGALFGAITLLLGRLDAPALWIALFRYLAFINVALAVFNLLPGYPLDGGRLLRAWFWHRSGSLAAATARAGDWGAGIALGIMVLGGLQIFAGALMGGLWLIFIGMFLRGAARAGVYGVLVDQVLRGARVADLMIHEPVTVPPELPLASAIEDYFLRYGYGGFPVAVDGRVEGLLALPHVRECPAAERGIRRVRDAMRPLADDVRIAPAATAAEALRRMGEAGTGRLLVMEGPTLRGLITRDAISRFVQLRGDVDE